MRDEIFGKHFLKFFLLGGDLKFGVPYKTFSFILLCWLQVYCLGTILSMQISFVGFQPVQSSEHMAVWGTGVRGTGVWGTRIWGTGVRV